ncbi:hypothetical protein [Pseudomonas vanderleydeniana]|uniref:Uncharacterized protein n=1 Tax=Pseudomonas vanderleydeniana TaxID=2745495 RepID=A0A9E6PQ73_9PSED|nr:hypothetical protein [Pseudomonas vanderleydeniana]QXI30016.1 hypothetical protein HU752_008710 [Pseudomonas vanderleydeniana]
MISKLSISLISALACSYAFANPPGKAEDVAYAIENPLRPGAKAPYCETQTEAFDGCTFHSVAGDAYRAKLMVKQGETWVASTSDAATIKFQDAAATEVVDGKTYQVIKVEPSPAKNADVTVTFDKLTGGAGALKVIERRRINVMIHPA